eukprot:12544607-Alexandrium_andersonii.AAC.1
MLHLPRRPACPWPRQALLRAPGVPPLPLPARLEGRLGAGAGQERRLCRPACPWPQLPFPPPPPR